MSDRYVIVYRDGDWSQATDKVTSDDLLAFCRKIDSRLYREHHAPAYRIRIREKAVIHDLCKCGGRLRCTGNVWLSVPPKDEMRCDDCGSLTGKPRVTVAEFLDASRALYEVTGRTVAAGAEKPWSVPDVGPGKPV